MCSIPGNGIYVVQGEMSILLTAMRKGTRWSSHSHQDDENDLLIKSFSSLKDILNQIGDLRELEPIHFLGPFLEVIRSEDITGPVTSLALSSISKFISYGLIVPEGKCVPAAVESIADAVSHARFIGTDPASDGVVLMKILQVLKTLFLSPVGVLLTNDSVCEIMLSCLRICFETRLVEVLRRCAEHYLKEMIQLLFTRLPNFSEDLRKISIKKLKMRSGAMETTRGHRKSKIIGKRIQTNTSHLENQQPYSEQTRHQSLQSNSLVGSVVGDLEETPTPDSIKAATPDSIKAATPDSDLQNSSEDIVDSSHTVICKSSMVEVERLTSGINSESHNDQNFESPSDQSNLLTDSTPQSPASDSQEWFNSQGVRFMPQEEGQEPLLPYGLLCVRELFRFLVSLCNPLNKENSEMIIHVGLSLLTVALEVGADAIGHYSTLLAIVKDDLCRNLFMLLNSERLSTFSANLQLSFLLFESLRTHLKFQLERFLSRLTDIIILENPKVCYEQKEIALESVVRLWRIPGFVTELYLNYDCDLYCPNMYEELTKLLSKNAFPVYGVFSIHLLSLDALLTIVDSIESHCNSRILNEKQKETTGKNEEQFTLQTPCPSSVFIIRSESRQKISQNIPSHEQLMATKRKKKLLATGTEHFNIKPKKGIQFLQEHHLLSTPLDPQEVVNFLRENPHLDKKMIGEFISNRSNLLVLDCFVKSFDFTDMRIDEALRLYLETFRLPGESPLISLLMEHFAEHWHKCNGEPFANADAAFTLAYAVIMLNVDQHNHNVKRQNNPMTSDEFKRNLKNVNGDKNFDQDMLDDIYTAIKSEEIVMPAEQTGLVKENYLWKVLLRRGEGKDGLYVHAPNGLYDHDLFSLIWSPTVAALSIVFDKSSDPAIYQKSISGFRKCAMISAHYGMSNEFDNLIVSLCKFTTLINSNETPEHLTISFGSNPKARLAAKTVFNLAHRHGDIIHEGWRNVFDCILQLYRCKILPKMLIEAEDFIELSGKISLIREEIHYNQKTETGILSSLYSYISLGTETANHKVPSPEDQDHILAAQACVRECHLEQLITESKFLRLDSLHQLVKALIHASYGPEGHISLGNAYNEDTAVFFLEFLLKVVIQNRDRVSIIWQVVRDHVCTLLMGAAACDHLFLVERCVVGLLRLAIRLTRREDMSPAVLQSLRMLLLLKAPILSRVSREVAYGLYDLLKTSAANIHTATDWSIVFTLLECVGAGAPPPRVMGKPSQYEKGAKSDGEVDQIQLDNIGMERKCTSDSELSRSPQSIPSSGSSELSTNTAGSWIVVGKEGDIQPISNKPAFINHSFSSERELCAHDPYSLAKCCESLAFLVRDVAHITPYNFENCVHCIRTFVEASVDSGLKNENIFKKLTTKEITKVKKKATHRKKEEPSQSRSPTNSPYDADESDSEELPSGYHQVPIQLLDLMHTLHTRTAQIYKWWAEENAETDLTSLWSQGWCPLLQGISRLCCDARRQVRMSAMTYLQRALLMHDLQTLTGDEWESCFNKVLFPLLGKLLTPITHQNQHGLEETRMRAATVLSKVFLHHLTPLQSLPTFTALWLTILDFMDKYMQVEKNDLLSEAIPESLKNMLLVMDSAGVFSTSDGYSPLWDITWTRIETFLPNLKLEVFKTHYPEAPGKTVLEEVPNQPTPTTNCSPFVSNLVPANTTSLQVSTLMSTLVSTPIGPPNPSSPPCPPSPTPASGTISLGVTPNKNNSFIPIQSSLVEILPMESQPVLPVYSGFATLDTTNNPTKIIPSSARFFYEDVPQLIPVSQNPSLQNPGG
uniref:SEC7 domain-containing protein n=2 Tax=Clastoptera arizonana TaxID=38151 RepID=A0A1B6C7R4_9HEMI